MFKTLSPLRSLPPQVHGESFIIQRIEAMNASQNIFPKLRLRKLHQRPRTIQCVRESEGEAAGTSTTAMVRAGPAVSGMPVVFEGQPVIDVTPMLELLETEQWPANTTCTAAIHVPTTSEQVLSPFASHGWPCALALT